MKILICFDLDGTLANIEHRVHWVRTAPRNWAAFEAGIPYDTVNAPVAKIFEDLAKNPYSTAQVLIASGRSEASRAATEKWLKENFLTGYLKLYMRKDLDYRSDVVVKQEILEEIVRDYGRKPDMVFDDRKSVVDMWRRNGIWVFDCNQSGEEF